MPEVYFIMVIVSVLIFGIKFYLNKINGIDIFRWIHYAIQIKENNYILPDKMTGYLDEKPFNYPPLFLYLLSFFPKHIIKNFPFILNIIIYVIECFLLFLIIPNNFNPIHYFIIFFFISYFRYSYFSSRPLSNLLISLFFVQKIILNYELTLIIEPIIFFILFYSHRFSIQFLFFSLLFLSFLNVVYLSSLIIFLSVFFILYKFSSIYRRVFINHKSILSYYYYLFNYDSKSSKFKFPHFKYKRFLNSVIISNIHYLLMIYFMISNTNSLNIELNLLILFITFISFLTCISTFSFFGEPERLFDYLVFPFLILSFSLDLNDLYILLSTCILVLIFKLAYRKYFSKNIYNSSMSYTDLVFKLNEYFKSRSFSFSSYPALYDDFINYKFSKSKVFFHDNGLSLKYNNPAYIPDFIGIDIDHLYFQKIFLKYNIDVFLIHKNYLPQFEKFNLNGNFKLIKNINFKSDFKFYKKNK